MSGNKDWRAIRKARRENFNLIHKFMFYFISAIGILMLLSPQYREFLMTGKKPTFDNPAQSKSVSAGSSVNQNSLNAGMDSKAHNPAPIPQELLRRENAEAYPGSYNLAQRKSAYSGSYNLSHGKNYSDSGSMANQNIFNTEAVSQSNNPAYRRPQYSQRETILSLDDPYNPGEYDKNIFDNTVKALDRKCYDRNCGINCANGSCTVERTYPGTDIRKKTLYGFDGKPLRMEYCLVKDQNGICSAGGFVNYRNLKTLVQKCESYDKNGKCTQREEGRKEYISDEKGNNIRIINCSNADCSKNMITENIYDGQGNKVIQNALCTDYSSSGECKDIKGGNVLKYDAGGRKISERTCLIYHSNKTCAEYAGNFGMNIKYDGKGNDIYSETCSEVNERTGVCSELASSSYRKYGSGKEAEAFGNCAKPDGKGSCAKKTDYINSYEYNDKGDITKRTVYAVPDSAGKSGRKISRIQKYNITYDRQGHKTNEREYKCEKTDEQGKCVSGWKYQDMVFDENNRVMSRKVCKKMSDSGTCIDEIPAPKISLYDDNGTWIDGTLGLLFDALFF